MNLARLHAVLAAAVERPSLIEQWISRPMMLDKLGVDPAGLNLQKLRQFAGLAVKVRHNALREFMPISFRLMSVGAIEVEIFADYAMFRSKKELSYAATTSMRASDFIDFLEDWINQDERSHVLLWDAIRFEYALARLGPWFERGLESNDNSVKDFPRIHGAAILYNFQSDPYVLANVLYEAEPDLSRIPTEEKYLCFWRGSESGGVSILGLDAFGFHLLSFLDGQHSIATIARCFGGGSEMRNAVDDGVRALLQLGIVSIPQ
jgi:hypothetical protein